MREDNTNLVVDILLELFGREGSVALAGSVTLFKQLSVNLSRPVGVGDGGRVRGQLAVDGIGFLVICQTLLHNRLNLVELRHKAGRKYGKSHNLDEADIFFFDVVILGMRMEDAKRMLFAGNVAAQCKKDLVSLIFKLAYNRSNRVVRLAISLCVNRGGLVGIVAPCRDDKLRSLECFFSTGGGEAEDGERPLKNCARYLGELLEFKLFRNFRAHHRELVTSALVVIMREDRSTHNRQVGIRANKVVGESVHKVKEIDKRLVINVHRNVIRVHGNAMLVEIRIRTVLESPTMLVELNGDDAQVLPGRMSARARRSAASGVALIIQAELACGVLLARSVLSCFSCCNLTRIFFWLGEVDGNLKVSPGSWCSPGDVSSNGTSSDIAGIAAERVEPVSCCARSLRSVQLVEMACDLGRLWQQKAHNAHGKRVLAALGVLDKSMRNS